jgi:hypothetical protein
VIVGALLSLDHVLEFLGHVDLFWDFDSLSKEEHKSKRRSRDLGPFLGFWEYVMRMGCGPMCLPMFSPIL